MAEPTSLPQFFDFMWTVPVGGHRWYHVPVNGSSSSLIDRWEWAPGPGTEPALLPAEVPETSRARSYAPLQEFSGLFLTLAEAATAADVLSFANRFGDLGLTGGVTLRSPWPESGQEHLARASLLRDWQAEINTLKPLVNLYLRIRQGDLAAVRAYIVGRQAVVHSQPNVIAVRGLPPPNRPQRIKKPSASRKLPAPGEIRASVFSEPVRARPNATATERYLVEDSTPSERMNDLATAFAVLEEEINAGLRDRSRHLHPLLGGGDVFLMPQTLIGAIWLQFARAVANRAEFRLCEASDCPRGWFEISTAPFGLRPEARFCSAQCRHRSKNARQKEQHGTASSKRRGA